MTSPASSGLRVAARRAARLSTVAAVAVPRTSASDSQRTVNRAAAEKRPAGSLDRPSPGGSLLIALRLLPAENSTREALGLGSPHPQDCAPWRRVPHWTRSAAGRVACSRLRYVALPTSTRPRRE